MLDDQLRAEIGKLQERCTRIALPQVTGAESDEALAAAANDEFGRMIEEQKRAASRLGEILRRLL